jgi:hypothetical protein
LSFWCSDWRARLLEKLPDLDFDLSFDFDFDLCFEVVCGAELPSVVPMVWSTSPRPSPNCRWTMFEPPEALPLWSRS